MLDHALEINAQEQYQRIIATMVPYMNNNDRQKLMQSYLEIIDGKQETSGAIINRDRDRLRKILKSK